MGKIKTWIYKILLGGIPISPRQALWKLIDEENQKPEDEIRCDCIEAWLEAIKRVENYK